MNTYNFVIFLDGIAYRYTELTYGKMIRKEMWATQFDGLSKWVEVAVVTAKQARVDKQKGDVYHK